MTHISADDRRIVLITLDRESDATIFTRSDGMEARLPLPTDMFAPTSALQRLHWTLEGGGLLAVTKDDDDVIFEFGSATDPDGTDERVVVYLDQNQWSLLDKCSRDPADVPSADLAVAQELAEMVRARQVVLPVSSGHHLETAKRRNHTRRYSLGLTILQLSRGWQMRDPLQVRRDELYAAFADSASTDAPPRFGPVFTLRPGVLHRELDTEGLPAPDDFSTAETHLLQALIVATAYIDVMLDGESVEMGSTDAWVRANQGFTEWLSGQAREKQQKRMSIDAWLLADLQQDIAEEAQAAGLNPVQMSQWIRGGFGEHVSRLPAIGLYRELVHSKHLNQTERWLSNDLIDMLYLSCAAAYADVVICERRTAATLRQRQPVLGRAANVYSNLRDALPAVQAAIDSR